MMRVWMAAFWLATVVPLAALLFWMRPALVARWRQSSNAARLALAGLWLLGAGFLLARPHDDSFTGLDNMTYRYLAHAFLAGRGFHDPDVVLAEVPAALRENFLYHRGPVGRPTRDRVFQLSGWTSVETKPFFMPVLPLAAAAQAPLLAPERFVPLIGALWLAAVLAAGFCAGGGRGLWVAAALVLGTAWPAWFWRGFYAEGVGAGLVAGVVAAAAVRPLRGGMAALAGFTLGLAVSYHPTLVVLAGPVALALMLERREGKFAAALAAGLAAGLFPCWALTRWVCQPYGNWTRWSTLKRMFFMAPEHQAIFLAVGMLAVAATAALWAGFRPRVRAWFRQWDAWARPWGWLAAFALPPILIALLPDVADHALRLGAAATWSGLRWPYALLVAAAAGTILIPGRPVRERFGFAALVWGALLFLFVKGHEVPVGLWSQRRFLPIVLVGVAWLAAPLAAALASAAGRRRTFDVVAGAALAVAGLWNLVHWPVAFIAVNEQGATAWTQAIAREMGPDRRVVFDYYAHAVPYAPGLKHRALGLGEPSRDHWPEVADWLAPQARTGEVRVATSWTPCPLEDGFRLEEVFAATGRFPVVKAKAFFPAATDFRIVENHFMRAGPLAPGEFVAQDKTMDDSPIGLRGPWTRAKDTGAGRMARWTRRGSGIVGPVPAPGGRVEFQMEGAFRTPRPDWTNQTVRVHPPWGGEPAVVQIGKEWATVRVALARPADDAARPATGIYGLAAAQPYDPEAHGLDGYPNDLGVQVRRIIIRVEPAAPSVQN